MLGGGVACIKCLFAVNNICLGKKALQHYKISLCLLPWQQVEDKKLSALEHCLAALKDDLQKAPGKLQLDLFSQKGFIGLMVAGLYDNFLEGIVSKFAGLVKAEGMLAYIIQ